MLVGPGKGILWDKTSVKNYRDVCIDYVIIHELT